MATLIDTWAELAAISSSMGNYYILSANLDSSTPDYTGIGDAWIPIEDVNTVEPFYGTFDGNGFTISDIVCTSEYSFGFGLFGSIGTVFAGEDELGGNVYDLGIIDISFNYVDWMMWPCGGISGSVFGGGVYITRCYVYSDITNDQSPQLAGIAGIVTNSG